MALFEKCGASFLAKAFREEWDEHNILMLCWNCYKILKTKKMPRINVSNGLYLDDIPEELKLTELEQQLIAKVNLFMKIKKLPKNFTNAINC